MQDLDLTPRMHSPGLCLGLARCGGGPKQGTPEVLVLENMGTAGCVPVLNLVMPLEGSGSCPGKRSLAPQHSLS